jgi:hypothetical protein
MRLSTAVEAMASKRAFVVGMALLIAVPFPAAALAQNGTDPVTGFAREPIHVVAWPGADEPAWAEGWRHPRSEVSAEMFTAATISERQT